MCYDIKVQLEAQLTRAKRAGDLRAIEEIWEKLAPLTDLPLYHASGFDHPEILIYTDRSPNFPEVATWGLVPQWVADTDQLKKNWNSTLNARGESIFEKPSFRTAARYQRCIIYIDGFYEHHHFKGSAYPFFIQRKDTLPMALAGLYSEWRDPNNGGRMLTFTIVTTKGNALMAKIHNNPKLEGPRMPLILTEAMENIWLAPVHDESGREALSSLIGQQNTIGLQAHTVGKLRGKTYLGNVKDITQPVIYPELDI